MNYQDFLAKYLGGTWGYPTQNDYLGECLSLVKWYIKECFKFSPPASGTGGAYGYWSVFPNPLGTYFNKVENTPTGVPKQGDIIIWNTNVGGGHGHISIFDSGDVNQFISCDQNYYGKQAHLQKHNWTNVVGWLTPKGVITSDTQEIDQLKKKITDLETELDDKRKQISNYVLQVEGLTSDVKNLNIELSEEKAHYTRDMQLIAEKLATTDGLTEILKEIEKLIVAEEGLQVCLDGKRTCENNYASKATELKEVYENIKLLSGYSIASPKGVEKALQAYASMQAKVPPSQISEYSIIIRLFGETIWLKK